MLIGEVSRQSGISARMLRHYDRIGLVSPSERTHSGYRRYSAEDLRRLFHVEGLRSLGLSLKEIEGVLGELAFDPGPLVDQISARTRTRLARDEELLRRLNQIQTSNPAAWSDVLRTIGLMRGLEASDPSSRQRLILALTSEGGEDVVSLAEAALQEHDPNVSGAFYWALARNSEKAIPVLAEALNSSDAERRRRAVAALEKVNSPHALAVLADAFRHADPFVSARAVLARAALGRADTVPVLVALIVDGRDDVEAADALGILAAQEGCADRIVCVIDSELANVPIAARLRLTAALAEVPGPMAEATLTALLDDPARGVALTASSVLRSRH